MKKTKKRKMPKALIYALAAYWQKDHRTIESWLANNNAMLEHPKSLEIINNFNSK